MARSAARAGNGRSRPIPPCRSWPAMRGTSCRDTTAASPPRFAACCIRDSLTIEYLQGRRARYLPPVRLYSDRQRDLLRHRRRGAGKRQAAGAGAWSGRASDGLTDTGQVLTRRIARTCSRMSRRAVDRPADGERDCRGSPGVSRPHVHDHAARVFRDVAGVCRRSSRCSIAGGGSRPRWCSPCTCMPRPSCSSRCCGRQVHWLADVGAAVGLTAIDRVQCLRVDARCGPSSAAAGRRPSPRPWPSASST